MPLRNSHTDRRFAGRLEAGKLDAHSHHIDKGVGGGTTIGYSCKPDAPTMAAARS